MRKRALGMRQLLAYGAVAVPLATAGLPLAIYVPPFYAQEVGVDLAMIGLVMMLARVTDVVIDPLIGVVSDRWATPLGRRRPWVLVGGAVMMLGAWKLFVPPTGAGAAYLLVWIFVLYLGWSLVNIPHNAWGAELSSDYHERSRITGTREMFMVTGLIVAAAVPFAVARGGTPGLGPGLRALATLTIAVVPIVGALVVAIVPEPPAVRSAGGLAWRHGLAIVWRNGPFKRLLAAAVLGGLAASTNQAVAVLFYVHALRLPSSAQGLLLLYFLAGVLAVPFWVGVSKRLTKHRTIVVSGLWACGWFTLAMFIPPERMWPVVVLNLMTGVSMAVPNVLGTSIAADIVDLDTVESGQGRAALFFAILAMATKLALALGVGLALPLLALVGFDPKGTNGPAEIRALTAVYCAVPVVFWLLALATLWNFPITPDRQAALREAITSRAPAA
jgi:glycoside/pentoside/hexuronide:cation symporter, GPH family